MEKQKLIYELGGRADENTQKCKLKLEQRTGHPSNFYFTKKSLFEDGLETTYRGINRDYHLTPQFMKGFTDTDYLKHEAAEAVQIENLLEHLTKYQWKLTGKRPLNNFVASPYYKEGEDYKETIPVIAISDNKVTNFDYIDDFGFLGIADYDSVNADLVCIPSRKLWDFLPRDIFTPIDGTSFLRISDLTTERVRELMRIGRRYQPDFISPCIRKSYLFLWNPATSSHSLDAHNKDIMWTQIRKYTVPITEHKDAKIGDRFYLIRCGEGNTGVVMEGELISSPFEQEEGDGIFFVEIQPHVMLNPDEAPLITLKHLSDCLPDINWDELHSGHLLTRQEAYRLDECWDGFVDYFRPFIDLKDLYIPMAGWA